MEKIAISKFKATCLAVLEQVRKTGKPIRVTRFGTPVADIVPPGPPERPDGWIGSLAGQIKITGDLITPSGELEPWEVEDDR